MNGNVFTYGSLMYMPVWRRVVGGDYQHHPAVLRGLRRLSIRGRAYPAAIPGEDCVAGVLWRCVSKSDLARLDRFEGNEYIRVDCEVEVSGASAPIGAFVYRYKDMFSRFLEDTPWDREKFEQTGLTQFLRRYPGFHHGQGIENDR